MEKLDQLLKDHVVVGTETSNKVLGAAFHAVNKDGVIYSGSAGRAGMELESAPFTADSFTWLASCSKIITAACLMQLVERQMIGLDDDTRQFVPELAGLQLLRGFDDDGKPVLEDNDKPITLRQLLTHTSGLGYDILDPRLQKWCSATGHTATNSDQTLDGWTTPLVFPPGDDSGWAYSSGLDWAGQVLEKVTGQGLEDYMQENIFRPLDMKSATFYPQRLKDTYSAVPCSYRTPAVQGFGLTMGPLPIPEDPPIEGGGSGLHSTARDFGKFLQAILRSHSSEDALDGKRILGKETVQEMFRPQLSPSQCQALKLITSGMLPLPLDTPINHGISGVINAEHVPGKRGKGSMMWGGFSNAHWWIDPEAGIAGTLFTNVIPQPDPVVQKLYDLIEPVVYSGLL
ncbi:beta-lactamase/transpeptidase-like protein [Zalerion maritima]|uniref:Beta-lactamase/transpeptidase-like protein n=1 Tax=Zalerion maritima TaxID=339359 RepID=A0AAD5RGT6_9PEZI|nr:beta-lactamase/transpeptidase-like protein [Zalerion maritima]